MARERARSAPAVANCPIALAVGTCEQGMLSSEGEEPEVWKVLERQRPVTCLVSMLAAAPALPAAALQLAEATGAAGAAAPGSAAVLPRQPGAPAGRQDRELGAQARIGSGCKGKAEGWVYELCKEVSKP